MAIARNIENETFCPYVCRIEHGKPVADNVFCDYGASERCKTCGWYPEEAARRSKAIKDGKAVEKITARIDTTELTGRARSKGTHIFQFIKDCEALILNRMER